jgi:hypothetical protein
MEMVAIKFILPNNSTTHNRCEAVFLITFGYLPCWIDPSATLRMVTKNVQGIKHVATNDKLQSGIANMVSLQAGIICLTESNVEWQNYSFRQGYKAAFAKLYAAPRHTFSSYSKVSTMYHKRGCTAIYATDRWTHHVQLAGEDSTGAGRWS